MNNSFLSDDLRKYGWIEGRNLIIQRRGAEGDTQRVPVLAAELVRLNVDVIVAFGAVASLAAKNATPTIPIVTTTGDPVVLGLVVNLSHPGGNITGVTTIAPELAGKRLEVLRTLLPKATRIAELVDPANQYISRTRSEYEKVFQAFRMQAIFVEVATPAELGSAFADISRQRAEALIVRADPMFLSNRERIMGLALQRALPTMTEGRRFVAAGGLVSYAPKEAAMLARTVALVDKILNGAKPADLPVEQPTEFELLVNLKTAKALGLTLPQSLLLRADEVIK
jgi:putative ABC transport system substrate-binding protein